MKRVVTAAFVVLAAFTIACGANSDSGERQDSGKEKKITFEVTGTGTGKVSITYGYGADQSQENDVTVPWTKEVTAKGEFITPTITAQAGAEGNVKISCKIVADGKVIKQNRSTGSFAVVTCTADKM